MKTIIINKEQVRLLKEGYEESKKEMTFFAFMSHVKAYLKQLITDPISAKPDMFLMVNGLDGEKLNGYLTDNNIILKNEKIDNNGEKDMFTISYKIPRQNFERKMKRLYSKLFEENIVDSNLLTEDGEGGIGIAGATNCNGSSGAFVQPVFKTIVKRSIRNTDNDTDEIKEEVVMDTAIGDFGYDAPPFKQKKKDPTLNHKNMMKKSFNGNDEE